MRQRSETLHKVDRSAKTETARLLYAAIVFLLLTLLTSPSLAQDTSTETQPFFKFEVTESPSALYIEAYRAGQNHAADFLVEVNGTDMAFFATLGEAQQLVSDGITAMPFLTEASFALGISEFQVVELITAYSQGYWHATAGDRQLQSDFGYSQRTLVFPDFISVAAFCGLPVQGCIGDLLVGPETTVEVAAVSAHSDLVTIIHENRHQELEDGIPFFLQHTKFNWHHRGRGTVTQVNTDSATYLLVANADQSAMTAFDLDKINEVWAEFGAHGPLVAVNQATYDHFYASRTPLLEFEKLVHQEISQDTELLRSINTAAKNYDIQTFIQSVGIAVLRVQPNFVEAMYHDPDHRRYSHRDLISPNHEQALADLPPEIQAGLLFANELNRGTSFYYYLTHGIYPQPEVVAVPLVTGELGYQLVQHTLPDLNPIDEFRLLAAEF